jgi:hypothetical protein
MTRKAIIQSMTLVGRASDINKTGFTLISHPVCRDVFTVRCECHGDKQLSKLATMQVNQIVGIVGNLRPAVNNCQPVVQIQTLEILSK